MNLNRKRVDKIFRFVCKSCTYMCVAILFVLLFHIFKQGISGLDWAFLSSYPSRFASKAGLYSALMGTLWVLVTTAFVTLPLGVATAVFLEEYSDSESKLVWLLRVNISSLAGMPSVVYGLLGLAIFVRFFSFERSVLSGALTLSLLVLPVVIIASREAIRAVPQSLRDAALALGARKWQVVWGQVLPAATPGIMTGAILAISRAIGETAPLIMIGALSYVAFVPGTVWDPFTVLPVQIYNWAARPQKEFHAIAATGIIVLLAVLFVMNSVAVVIRHRFQRYKT